METAWITIAAITVLGMVYVTLPIFVDYFRHYHHKRVLRCPETGGLVEVDINARRAAWSSLFGKPLLKVKNCTLWPKRKGCNERCIK
jgi:hypothetical protein